MLYLVSTPIGNMADISIRAIAVLKSCDYVLVEDTRRTGLLLKHHDIKNKMISFNDINDARKTPFVIEDLKQGKEICLVTDNGTPGINDPGFFLVRECVRNNILVTPVPGASAFLAALVCSGLPSDKFTYYGFMPKTSFKRNKIIEEIQARKETAIFYESPHRILATLKDLEKLSGKQVVVARELTKKFEEFVRGSPEEVYQFFTKKTPKGEFVVLVY